MGRIMVPITVTNVFEPGETRSEALVGHTVLQLARAAVDLVHDRLVRLRHLDLKIAS